MPVGNGGHTFHTSPCTGATRAQRSFFPPHPAPHAPRDLARAAHAAAACVTTAVVIDTSSNASCEAAVAALVTPLDWLILNAGGIGATPQNITDSGAACLFAQNIVGHAVLVEGLIAAGTLNKGGRVVLSGSEQARGECARTTRI